PTAGSGRPAPAAIGVALRIQARIVVQAMQKTVPKIAVAREIFTKPLKASRNIFDGAGIALESGAGERSDPTANGHIGGGGPGAVGKLAGVQKVRGLSKDLRGTKNFLCGFCL